MNYLAHAWLARQSDAAILGALLGDFVFGQAALRDWPDAVRREIVVHRRIDRYTDAHPEVAAARALLPDGLRRYAGIVLDVHFDHLLARGWERWNAAPLDSFTARVYRVLRERGAALPPRLRAIAPRMQAHDWLGSYRERDNVDHAVRGIATRLSRHGDRLVECLPWLRAHEARIEAAFERFFPQLVAEVPLIRDGVVRAAPDG
jgi:acyl carrier protein phosphodiesterase